MIPFMLDVPNALEAYLMRSREPLYLKEVLKTVNQIETGSDRIRYCYNLVKEANLLPKKIDFDCKKDERKAILAKELGNAFFMTKEYTKALKYYNESLCLAPEGTECFATAYANRSAVYLKTGFFKFCLDNIELALQSGYPESEKSKLFLRKDACMKRMETETDSLIIYRSPDELKLSYSANPKIPFIVDSLYCKTHEIRGRGIYTSRNLMPGDVIAIEEPFQVSLIPKGFYTNCNYCQSMNFLNLKPCSMSTAAMFCSEECAKTAWNRYHKYEYPVLHGLSEYIPSHFGLLNVRAALNALTMVESVVELQELIDSIDVETENALDIDFKSADERSKFRAFYALKDHVDSKSPERTFMLSCMFACVWHIFKEFSPMKEALESREFEDMFLNLMHKFLGISSINSNLLTNARTEYGEGVALVGSLFNHSCAPNVSATSGSKKTVFFVNRPIKTGEELFLYYTCHFLSDPLSDRQIKLLRKYSFECKCDACRNNYPLYEDLPRKNPSIQAIVDSYYSTELKSRPQCFAEKKRICRAIAKEVHNYPSRELINCEIALAKVIELLTHTHTLEQIHLEQEQISQT